jgi:hypothetical protein
VVWTQYYNGGDEMARGSTGMCTAGGEKTGWRGDVKETTEGRGRAEKDCYIREE